MHEQWMSQNGRTYENDAEKKKRFNIFMDNVNFVEKFNREGNRTYKLRINEFSDLTNEEFIKYNTGYRMPIHHSNSPKNTSISYQELTDMPKSIDWREHGAVTPIKKQAACGKRKHHIYRHIS